MSVFDPARDTIALILKAYPRLSETFIAQEIQALEQSGLRLVIVALRKSTDKIQHPIHDTISAPIHHLPEYLYQDIYRLWCAWWCVKNRPGFYQALRCWLYDFCRDPTPSRGRRFGQAIMLAEALPKLAVPNHPVNWFYAHFLHSPASVTRYAALICGLEWSCSAHAKDIWTIPDWEKREKLAAMAWLTCCSKTGRDHLAALASPRQKQVRLAYHGLDLSRLPPPPVRVPGRAGTNSADPLILTAIGRLVDKKGFDTLIEALGLVGIQFHWKLLQIGDGVKRDKIETLIKKQKLSNQITLMGAQSRDTVFSVLQQTDMFILPARITRNGDRDGLPNVLMEAASQQTCLISTRISAIPEFIEHGRHGWLVSPDDPSALATALIELAGNPDRRAAMAQAAYMRLIDEFSVQHGITELIRWFYAPKQAQ